MPARSVFGHPQLLTEILRGDSGTALADALGMRRRGLAVASHWTARFIASAAAMLIALLIAACSADAGGDVDHEVAHEDVAKVAQAVTHDCTTSTDTGYTSGTPTPITLVTVQGKRVEIATADAYMAMADAAASAGVYIGINSGFRTNAEQIYLYNCYKNCNCNGCNLAAAPGYSNHQSGHALDLNTSAPGVYNWLTANAAAYGFRRTVPSEPWHWEWWGGGPGTTYCQSCDRSAAGFTFSCDGPNAGKTCVNLNEPSDPNSWGDNFLCTDSDIGLKWSFAGAIAGMRCVNVNEPAEAYSTAWADNFLCLPEDSQYVLEWSTAGPLGGKACIQWNETADPHSWGDNHLCVGKTSRFRSGVFTFSSNGAVDGQTCVNVDEPSDPKTWADNFLCSSVDLGIKWSFAGPIAGMNCTNVAEPAEHDPKAWEDNYLCLPPDSSYEFTWSTAGKLAGMDCVRWYEDSDVSGSWSDNYLCYRLLPKPEPVPSSDPTDPDSNPSTSPDPSAATNEPVTAAPGAGSGAIEGTGCDVASAPSRRDLGFGIFFGMSALVVAVRRKRTRKEA